MYYVYWIHSHLDDDPERDDYIGITNNVDRRFKEHVKRCIRSHLKNAIDCYGWDNLYKDIYCVVNSKEEALAVEGCLRPCKNVGWNIIKGGVPTPDVTGHKYGVGRVFSEESKTKLSKSLTGNKNGLGAKHSAEANAAKSLRLSGENSYSNKLSIEDVIAIDGLLKQGLKHNKIADMFGVTRMTITTINTRRCKYYREVLGV